MSSVIVIPGHRHNVSTLAVRSLSHKGRGEDETSPALLIAAER
jgi:hypothetical protein